METVELANGQGDAFLHANALHASGHENVPAGAKLKVTVGAGAKGAQVTRVVEVDAAGKRLVSGLRLQPARVHHQPPECQRHRV